MRAVLGALSSISILLVCTVSSAQPTVRVRSETRIELRTVRHTGYVVVEGALRDDLGEPLPERELVLRARPDAPGEAPLRHVLTSDRDGAFRVRMDLSSGGHRLSAAFAGDSTHERVEVERRLDLDRADVRLRVVVPAGGRLDLDRTTHRIEVVAESIEGGAGLQLDLLDELDRPLASAVTDETGQAVFILSSEALGPPGAGRVKARSRADALRAEAQTEVPVVRFRATELDLSASRAEARPGDDVRFSGVLRDSTGPLDGRAVGVFAGDEHLATVLTTGDGTFAATVRFDATHEGALDVRARYESDSPGRAGSESEPVAITIASPRSMPWHWLLVPLVVCALLLALIARRAPKRPEKSVAAPPERPLGIRAARRRTLRADRTDVGGRVLDHRSEEPVADAEVEVSLADRSLRRTTTDEDGSFSIEGLPPGPSTLRVLHEAFVETEAAVTIPHRGEWSDATVRLESMRSRALEPYRLVAAEVLPAPRLWSIWTNREVLERARRGGRPSPPLEELTGRVEEAYYGPRSPTAADVSTIEERAEETLRQLQGAPAAPREDP